MIRISVCMATYNGEKFIKEQIDSILNQIGQDDEIVISDDNSTDNTINIIKEYNDKRIKIIYNNKESGYTQNFINALVHSEGEFIFLSDQDDIWVKNKVSITLEYLVEKKYDTVISDCKVVDHRLNVINQSFFDVRGMKKGFLNNIIKTGYLGCCLAFNRKVLEFSLPFPKNHKYVPHDLWLGLISYAYFKVATIDDKLILYRRHNTNVSDGGFKSNRSLFFKVKFRLYALLKIINKYFIKKS